MNETISAVFYGVIGGVIGVVLCSIFRGCWAKLTGRGGADKDNQRIEELGERAGENNRELEEAERRTRDAIEEARETNRRTDELIREQTEDNQRAEGNNRRAQDLIQRAEEILSHAHNNK